ncbi:four helix bundle protein [Tamlana crocina]|uniref:Four helix bundle protein n=1 Tax=Tamlana crocina TaxID=393006 RepID=A0ABX1DDX4_9FLAO|nr:four helix bundle protein [Tamlana crocina]NJX15562.1 four helix bundle protein [Tamlana crocina]
MKFKFEDLIIWQKGMDLGEDMNILASKFPKDERYNLSSQLKRASDSIALNISEGSILQSGPEYIKILGYAIKSLAEVVTCLHKAKRRNYLEEDSFIRYYKDCFDLMNMTIAFRNKIKIKAQE